MRQTRGCSSGFFTVVVAAVAAATVLSATSFASSGAASEIIARFAAQQDPLAKPRLGRNWVGFGAKYALKHRSITMVRGTHVGSGGCAFDSSLSLAVHRARTELRERAINVRTCQAIVERGVPPVRPDSGLRRPGYRSRADSHTYAFPQLTFPALPDPLAGQPGGEYDPNQPVPPDLVDPADAEPGNTDAVPQPGAGAEADPGPPNGDECQTAPCSPPALNGAVRLPCVTGRPATNGDCCIDHDCRDTYPTDPQEFARRRLPPGWYTSAGEFHSWWEDPVQIDVASDRDRVSYPFGNGCVHNPFSISWQLNWYTTSGWYLQSDNHRNGAVCGYGYQSTYAEMKNDVFCPALVPLFGRTSRAYFDRNVIRGLGNGALKGEVRSVVKGGCVRLLHFNYKLTRTAP
jgi:hypothetical protein